MTMRRNITRKSGKQAIKGKNSAPPKVGSASREAKPSKRPKRIAARGKIGTIVKLLSKPKGASIVELCAATGWQSHSVRGALSGTIKKKLGLPLLSEKTDKGRIYRIVE